MSTSTIFTRSTCWISEKNPKKLNPSILSSFGAYWYQNMIDMSQESTILWQSATHLLPQANLETFVEQTLGIPLRDIRLSWQHQHRSLGRRCLCCSFLLPGPYYSVLMFCGNPAGGAPSPFAKDYPDRPFAKDCRARLGTKLFFENVLNKWTLRLWKYCQYQHFSEMAPQAKPLC